ncbi:MAG: tRNA (adenosine(37)-N6)-threonylcarbamoyltransferase complex dimerization subunit type 1 TsaB [Lachnospiraceae bacterium]|nr:tRNA (adenosine(37)-N6)-threonylcarbamoyltransferase complex dimerization subunit type 1 TsaB [Lachnospiraceae bacterium]
MKILAIDSSGQVASVAVVTEDAVLGSYSVNYKKTHSQTLLPMVEEVMKMTETEGADFDAIAVTNGPGSYTGLRIGSSTAKGLAMVWNKPVVPVPTVDALAANLAGRAGIICPIMDARRGQVYTGLYRFDGNRLVTVKPQVCTLLSDVIDEMNAIGETVTFLGDGVPVHKNTIAELVKVPYTFAPMHLSMQNAAALGWLATEYFREGRTVTAAELVPEYLRQSQAEREREERLEHHTVM